MVASEDMIPGITGITVRRRSQAFFDSIDPLRTVFTLIDSLNRVSLCLVEDAVH
jgi:hypothetical protein